MKALGATEEQLAEEREKLGAQPVSSQDDVFEVYEENCDALAVFLDCFAEWEEMNGCPAAIRRPALLASMELFEIVGRKDCLGRVQVMEAHVRQYFAENSS